MNSLAHGLSDTKTELLKRLLEERSRRARAIRLRPRDPAAKKVRMPASWAQQRLWFIDQLEDTSGAYHIPVVLRLKGALDTQALQQALDAIVQRHETLRTVFESEDGEPWQVISREATLPLDLVDLSEHDDDDRETRARTLAAEEASAPFDLRTGPLMRARLVRLAREEHLFLVTMHHIVSDGWSLGVFMRELSELYVACREHRASALPALSIQYADYAQWQREWLQGATLKRQLDYWQERLAGAPAELALPKDRARPAVRSYRGGSIPFSLDAGLCAGLRALAQRHDMTLFMVLHAAWAILLSRLSGQEDIVVGMPVANRQRPEVEGLIGFLVNTVALRVQVQGATTVRDFFVQAKEATLGACDHQDVPFEQVVERVQPERSLNRHPLFQVMLALQNAARIELRLPGVVASMEDDAFAFCKFDLVLALEAQDDTLAGTLGYSADLFDRETVERWAGFYEVLLRDLVQKGTAGRVADLQILTERERQNLRAFNASPVPYPHETLLHELFEEHVRRTPDAPAVISERGSITFDALNRRANRLARHLQACGVGRDHLVGLCVERGIDLVVGMLATWKAGGAYVPLDPEYPRDRLAYMLRDATPTALLVQERLKHRLPPSESRWISIDQDWPAIAVLDDSDVNARADGLRPHHLAYVIYTSGSTGRPKGVMVEHRQVTSLWQGLEHLYRQSPPCHRIGVNASFTFDASVKQLIQVLSGRTLVMIPAPVRSDVAQLLDFIEAHRIDGIDCTPSQLRLWVDEGLLQRKGHRPRVVLVGGEAIDADLWTRLAACRETHIYNVYGPTESTVDTTAARINGDTTSPHIGRPMENRQVWLLDPCGQPVPAGVPGEICIGGAGVARGYLKQPELTAQRFVPDVIAGSMSGDIPGDTRGETANDTGSRQPAARLYRTGDIGRWRPDGNLEYLGRNDEQVKIRGFRVELPEIEHGLMQHPEVKQAAVVARPDGQGELRLVAYVVRSTTRDLDAATLREHLRAFLPDHMVPAAFVFLESLPLNPSGKLDRRALPEPDPTAFAARRYEAPEGEVECTLAEIWRDLLCVPRVGRDDNFFELGGHSLIGMKLVARIAERCGVRLPAVAIFRHPTVRQLAETVQRMQLEGVQSEQAQPGRAQSEPEVHGAAGRGASSGESGRDHTLPQGQVERHGPRETAPLTFSQLAHLRHFRLHGEAYSGRCVRVVWSAMRIEGLLDLDVFRQALDIVVRRHDALRTRILKVNGVLTQVVSPEGEHDFQVLDLSTLPAEERARETDRVMEQFILEPVDRTADPLLAVRLLKRSNDEHMLVVAMDHAISDGTSLNLFVRELLTACMQLSSNRPVSLPPIGMQFSQYAAWQQGISGVWLAKHEHHWHSHFADCGRLRLPQDRDPVVSAHTGWGSVPVSVGSVTKSKLTEWCRARGTTLVLAAFTAFAGVVLRWCRTADGVLQYQFNGRVRPDVENTIGFFASPLYLRIRLRPDDTLPALLDRVTSEYCRAYEHADFYYLASQPSPAELTANPLFNWTPLGSAVELPASGAGEPSLRCTPYRIADPIRKPLAVDHEPILRLCDAGEEISGYLFFPQDRFSPDCMERFVRDFVRFLQTLVDPPDQRVNQILLVD